MVQVFSKAKQDILLSICVINLARIGIRELYPVLLQTWMLVFHPNTFKIVVFVYVVCYLMLRFVFKHLYIDNSVEIQYQFSVISAIAFKTRLIEFVFIL